MTTFPKEIAIGDYSGVEFGVSVEKDVDFTECHDDHVCIHSEGPSSCTRYYHEDVGRHETYRVIDLPDGDRAVIALVQDGGVDPEAVEEGLAVFDSITFASNE